MTIGWRGYRETRRPQAQRKLKMVVSKKRRVAVKNRNSALRAKGLL